MGRFGKRLEMSAVLNECELELDMDLEPKYRKEIPHTPPPTLGGYRYLASGSLGLGCRICRERGRLFILAE